MNGEGFAIIKNSRSGAGRIIRQSGSGELLCQRFSGGSFLGDEELLSGGGCTDFDVFTDDFAAAHVFFADREGNLIYLRGSGEKWQRAAVVKAKERGISKIGQVFAFRNRLLQTVIYSAFKGGGKNELEMLTTGGGVPEIGAVDMFTGRAYAAQGENGDIYLFFTRPKAGGFGLRIFCWSKKDWGEYLSLGISAEADWLLPQASGENVNLCVKEGGELKFMQIFRDTAGQLKFSELQTLSRRHSSRADLPVMYARSGGLRLAWHEGGRVFSTETQSGSVRWSRLREEDFSGGGVFTAKVCISGENADRFDICVNDGGGVRGYDTGEIFSGKGADIAPEKNKGGADVFWGGSQSVLPVSEEIEQNKRKIMEMLKNAENMENERVAGFAQKSKRQNENKSGGINPEEQAGSSAAAGGKVAASGGGGNAEKGEGGCGSESTPRKHGGRTEIGAFGSEKAHGGKGETDKEGGSRQTGKEEDGGFLKGGKSEETNLPKGLKGGKADFRHGENREERNLRKSYKERSLRQNEKFQDEKLPQGENCAGNNSGKTPERRKNPSRAAKLEREISALKAAFFAQKNELMRQKRTLKIQNRHIGRIFRLLRRRKMLKGRRHN